MNHQQTTPSIFPEADVDIVPCGHETWPGVDIPGLFKQY